MRTFVTMTLHTEKRKTSFIICFLSLAFFCVNTGAQNIETIAGTGVGGYSGDNAQATMAQLYLPWGVAVDAEGNIYFADHENYRIRKIDVNSGVITLIAGTGIPGYSGDNGLATDAKLNHPHGIALDKDGNLYIADQYNHCIRRIDKSTGIITTIAGTGNGGYSGDDGPAIEAELTSPNGVAIDTSGNIYIADKDNQRIRKIDINTNIITTFAGTGSMGFSGDNGIASSATFSFPSGMCFDAANNLYIADSYNYRIRKVNLQTEIITTIAGTGVGGFSGDNDDALNAKLNVPIEVAMDPLGNIYISDFLNQRIRKIETSTGIISTIAGTGTPGYSGDGNIATNAKLNYPIGLATDGFCGIYVSDYENHRIRKITTLAPDLTVSNSVTLCYGESTSLSASASGIEANNYVWSPSSGLNISSGSIVNAQPNVTTTYTVSGCYSNNATVTISIDSVNANAGQDVVICSGSSTTLSASGGITYEWQPSYALQETTGASVLCSPSLSSNYSLTVTSVNGCIGTDEVMISVSASLTSNAGLDASICSGNTAILNGSGGSDYVWYPSESLDNPSIANPNANPTVTTTYTLQAHSGQCPTLPDYVTIEVVPYIDLEVPSSVSICPGDSISISTTGVASCSWTPSEGLSSITGISVIAFPTTNTTYSVDGSNECGAHTKEIVLNIRSNPVLSIAGNNIICIGDSTLLSASGAETYSWHPATDINTTTGADVYVNPTVNTPYFLTGVDEFGCESTKPIAIVVDPCTGIDENNSSEAFIIYPNPNKGKFFIKMNSGQGISFQIEIFDLIGNSILTTVIPAQAGISKSEEEINLFNQPKGMYLVKILDKNGQVGVKKVVLE